MNWKKIKKFLPIIGIAIFVYLIIKLDIVKVLKQISSINLYYIVLAVLITFVFFISQTLKWFVIARKQKIKVPFWDAFKINIITNFYGFITPAKVGTIIRADYLKKYEGGAGRGVSNFAIDKVLDLGSLFFLTIIFGFIFYSSNKLISLNLLYFFIGIFLMIMLFSLLFYKKEASKSILRVIYKKFIPNKAKEKARMAFDAFYENMPSLKFLFIVFLINLISWAINYIVFYFVGLSVGINQGLIIVLSILPISTLVAQIPITINGLGTRELTMISLFGKFGIDAIKVFTTSILTIIIMSIIPSIIALFFTLEKNDLHNLENRK